jgi:integrase
MSQLNEWTVLKQAIKWLIEAGHLPGKDPVQLPLKKAESSRAYCWTQEEVAAIVKYCRGNPNVAWIGDVSTALACTGLRISELATLRWADLDLTQRRLYLTDQTGHADQHNLGRRELKSGRSRSFTIHPDLLEVLVRQPRKDPSVFHGPRGLKLKPDTVRNALVKKVIAKLAPQFPSADGAKGFGDGRLHSFRHYFCSRCANSGVPERVIMEWLGHQDSEMVRHYYHLCDAESRRQMDGLDLLGSAGKRVTG